MSTKPIRPTKTQRLLDLLAFLSSRRLPVDFEEIRTHVPGYATEGSGGGAAPGNAVRRRFERDKRELRELGLPLETVPPPSGRDGARYQLLERDFKLPVLRLLAAEEEEGVEGGDLRLGRAGGSRAELRVRPDELRTAAEALIHVRELPAFPLRGEARSALAKLTFDLASEALGPSGRVLHLSPFDPVELEPALARASEALRRRKTLRFEYYAIGRDRTGRRAVHPYGLLFQGSRWYLVAHDLDRGEERLFRVDRMREVEVEAKRPGTPDYELPAEHYLRRFRDRRAWELGREGEETRVLVWFHAPLHLLARRNGWGEAVPEEVEAEGEVRRFTVRAPDPLLRWLLMHHGRAEIVQPASLRARLEELRERTLEAHR